MLGSQQKPDLALIGHLWFARELESGGLCVSVEAEVREAWRGR